jgi:hypothetical protein
MSLSDSNYKQMIYENSEILKAAITKTLSSIKHTPNNIILINISYYDGNGNSSSYSGLKYIINLRAEQKDITHVIFYGFESLERLMKKPDASILNSPAVEYIQMPFKVDELSEKLSKVVAENVTSDGLDKQTKQNNTLEKIRIFKHDVINAVNTVKTVYKLKRKGSIDTQKENWISVKKSIFMDKDLIRKNIAHFEAIEGNIIELLTEKAITGIKGNLSCSDDKYKTLLKHLARYSERNNEVVVYDADDIISLLNESVKILETVKV